MKDGVGEGRGPRINQKQAPDTRSTCPHTHGAAENAVWGRRRGT